MSLKKPIVAEVALDTYVINLFGLQSPALLVGRDRALLIDTGCGNYDFKALVESITDKPYDVVLTHQHGDHIGGMNQFPVLYAHPRDFDGIRAFDRNAFWTRYYGIMKNQDADGCFDIPAELIDVEIAQPELRPVTEGYVFDLGGRTVTVHEAPGHTCGEIVLVDNQSRILFAGDASNENLLIMGTSVEEARDGLMKLKTFEADWDRSITGHMGWGGRPFLHSDGKTMLDRCIFILKGICDGSIVGQIMPNPLGDKFSAEVDGVKVSYDASRIHRA